MDVLVAGGTGFLGTHLCHELSDRGHDVTALARDPGGADLPNGVDAAAGDVRAYDSIADTVADHEAVVNLVSLSPLFQTPSGTSHDEVHHGGTRNLVRAAEDGDVRRFVQISGLGADPDGPTAYIRAKGRAERVVRDAELEWVIVRPSVVFGDGAEFLEFTKQVTTPYLTGLPGGGSTRFQPIWIGDLAPLLADCVDEDGHAGETYEIGGPEVLTLADVTRLIYESEGRSVRVVPVPMALASVGLTVADPLPLVPLGADQARSLRFDNTVEHNDLTAFDVESGDLERFEHYLRDGGAARATPT